MAALCAAPTGLSAEPDGPATDANTTAADPAEFERALGAALRAFEAAEHQRALDEFDRAIGLTDDPAELSTLHFNAAVCAYELGHFEDAERRFARAAELGTDDRDAARLHAGFAALNALSLERAEHHLRRVSPSNRTLQLAAELGAAIETERARRAREQALTALRAAFAALQRGEYDAAAQQLERAESLQDSLGPQERGDLAYGQARVAEERVELRAALSHLRRARMLLPAACELHGYEARLLERLDEVDAAVASQRRALGCATTREQRERAEKALDALQPLGPSGFRGGAEVGMGYDSNAAQSGTAQGLDTANPGGAAFDSGAASPIIPSALTSLEGRVGYHHRLDFRWELVPRLSSANLILLNDSVRASSITVQELALGLGHAPSMRTRVEVHVGAAVLTRDMPAVAPLQHERFVGGEAAYTPSRDWSLWTRARFTDVVGIGDAAWVTGFRLDAEFGAHAVAGDFALGTRARLLWNSAGVATWTSALERFGCTNGFAPFRQDCDLLLFSVPASYLAPGLDVEAAYWPSQALRLSGSVGVQYRHYLASARVQRMPEAVLLSEKARRDLLLEPTLEARVFPWANVNVYAFFRESARLNSSNMQPDVSDPNHRFDYEDRNYSQYLSLLGVGATY